MKNELNNEEALGKSLFKINSSRAVQFDYMLRPGPNR